MCRTSAIMNKNRSTTTIIPEVCVARRDEDRKWLVRGLGVTHVSGLPGSQPTYCSVVRHVVYYPARSDPAAAKEQHRDLHPGRNTDRRDRVDGGRDGRARGAGTGKGTTAAAVAAALIRADDASRNALRRTMKIDRAASPMPPRARVLLLSFSRPSRPSSRPFKSSQ